VLSSCAAASPQRSVKPTYEVSITIKPGTPALLVCGTALTKKYSAAACSS
jgi:hypothetical protein